MMNAKSFLLVAALGLPGVAGAQEPHTVTAPPPDPFDYSYCGGKPVYPVIGFNFSTFCGPRNQIALGRRGRLMWLFPSDNGAQVQARGARQLSEAELAQLTLLAEVAHLAGEPRAAKGPVRYEMGIDFSGRGYRRVKGVVSNDGTSAMALFEAMRTLVPDAPLLPECREAVSDFQPTRLPAERGVRAGITAEAAHARP
jgi:hypothetical protein